MIIRKHFGYECFAPTVEWHETKFIRCYDPEFQIRNNTQNQQIAWSTADAYMVEELS